MKCPECGGINKDGSRYCQYCGKKFPSEDICPRCGKRLDESCAYCPECGAKIEKENKKVLKKIEYNLKDCENGFRYGYVVSNVLLLVEVAYCILCIIMGFTSSRIYGRGYYSYSSSASVPAYTILILVFSLVSYSGLRNFKKSSYVFLIIIHALLFLRDFGYIKRYLFFYSYGIYIFYGILALVALALHVLSLIYFVKRSRYYSN